VTPQEAAERLRDTRAFYRDGWPQYRAALEAGAYAIETLATFRQALAGQPPEQILDAAYDFARQATRMRATASRLLPAEPAEPDLRGRLERDAARFDLAAAVLRAAVALERKEVDR
jgi:hypothetical protein